MMLLLKIYSFVVTLALAAAVSYLTHKVFQLRKEEFRSLYSSAGVELSDNQTVKNTKWVEVKKLMESANESDWKLAIIEADKMLDEMLAAYGYQGDNLGDRLKGVEAGDMLSLNDAWEAHKYRNDIAHTSGFVVTFREARQIIALYQKVFEEYKYV